MGIDPYTSFPPVESRLGEVAWAAVGGSMTVGAAFGAVPGAGSTILRGTKTSQGLRTLIRDKTPAELKEINAGKLRQIGVADSLATAFLEHPKFSPTEKTLLVGALANVGIYEREVFIQRAVTITTETEAVVMRRWAEMIDAYHHTVAPTARIIRLGRSPAIQRPDGVIVWLLPVDHLAWTAQIAGTYTAIGRSLSQTQNTVAKEIWLAGTASAMARQALEGQGWAVRERTADTLKLN